jgi:hypothetical protein
MKRKIAYIAIAILTFITGVSTVLYWFSSPQAKWQSRLPEVLADFQLVCDTTHDRWIYPHGKEAKPFPQRFEAGRQYILHYSGSINDSLLFEELLKRFRSKGINISEADATDQVRLEKDALFRISFQDGIYAGYIERPIIYPDPDDSGQDKCPVTDYLLVITQARY